MEAIHETRLGRAEQVRREWLDSFDPTKIELKRLRMEKELKTVPLEVAVEKFLQDLKVNNRADGTLSRQALFGKKIIERFGAQPPVFRHHAHRPA